MSDFCWTRLNALLNKSLEWSLNAVYFSHVDEWCRTDVSVYALSLYMYLEVSNINVHVLFMLYLYQTGLRIPVHGWGIVSGNLIHNRKRYEHFSLWNKELWVIESGTVFASGRPIVFHHEECCLLIFEGI